MEAFQSLYSSPALDSAAGHSRPRPFPSIFAASLSLVALIGIILLIRVAKKNAIMMIDFALEAERNDGMTPEESIYQACLVRFGPIMMMIAAALLDALPLACVGANGSGNGERRY